MYQQFREFNFRKSTLALIDTANDIIGEYRTAGLTLTLRQLYYQFVARDIIPNSEKSYKNLGRAINDGRLAGLIDWSAIEDRTRGLDSPPHWRNPDSILQGASDSYAEDLWRDQDYRIEVWVEKEALAGVIEQACEGHRLPFLSCRGYLSQSEAYNAGKRIRGYHHAGQQPVILHLGDHDPSGIDMSRDNEERIREFSGVDIIFRRLALNWDQIERYSPPPNPAKMTDSRFWEYEQRFGDESWEIDALDPRTLINLVDEAVGIYKDLDRWHVAEDHEAENQEKLQTLVEQWGNVERYLMERSWEDDNE